MGEGSQDEERQFLALSQVLGFGIGFWHCYRSPWDWEDKEVWCGSADGDRAWDSLLAASVLPLGNGEDPKGKVERVLFASCLWGLPHPPACLLGPRIQISTKSKLEGDGELG